MLKRLLYVLRTLVKLLLLQWLQECPYHPLQNSSASSLGFLAAKHMLQPWLSRRAETPQQLTLHHQTAQQPSLLATYGDSQVSCIQSLS